jgi:uncharacterized membrane protein (DUF373 family)
VSGGSGPGARSVRRPGLRGHYDEFRDNWTTLGVYERFEQVVALVLTWLIAVVVALAVWGLANEMVLLLWRGLLPRLDHTALQVIFGQIATVLIALEFKHSITKVVAARHTIVQVRTVLLIAMLALARKFIIFDAREHSAATILALAATVVGLGLAYWLVRDAEQRDDER